MPAPRSAAGTTEEGLHGNSHRHARDERLEPAALRSSPAIDGHRPGRRCRHDQGRRIIAALTLLLDFDFITKGVEQQLPRRAEWYAAFGLMVTLIWLYISVLRLLAVTRR